MHQDHISGTRRGFMPRLKSTSESASNALRIWLDSGASLTFVNDRHHFSSYIPVRDSFAEIWEGRSRRCDEGTVRFQVESTLITLDAKHTPNFNENVVSVSSVTGTFRITFDSEDGRDVVKLFNRSTGEEPLYQVSICGLYPVPNPLSPVFKSLSATESINSMSQEWHEILGHPGRDRLIDASNADI